MTPEIPLFFLAMLSNAAYHSISFHRIGLFNPASEDVFQYPDSVNPSHESVGFMAEFKYSRPLLTTHLTTIPLCPQSRDNFRLCLLPSSVLKIFWRCHHMSRTETRPRRDYPGNSRCRYSTGRA